MGLSLPCQMGIPHMIGRNSLLDRNFFSEMKALVESELRGHSIFPLGTTLEPNISLK